MSIEFKRILYHFSVIIFHNILDKKGVIMSTRNDLNINNFETILISEKKRVQNNIDALKGELNSIGSEDEIDDAGDMSELQTDNANDQAILQRLIAEMAEIDAALGRIQAGTYGICEKTGSPIPLERLKANPSARTVVGA